MMDFLWVDIWVVVGMGAIIVIVITYDKFVCNKYKRKLKSMTDDELVDESSKNLRYCEQQILLETANSRID